MRSSEAWEGRFAASVTCYNSCPRTVTAQLGSAVSAFNPDALPACRHHSGPIVQVRMLGSREVESKDRVSFALGPVLSLTILCCLLHKC